MNREDEILLELRLLRGQVHRPHMRHGWLQIFFHDLAYNPKTQYKVHFYAVIFWLINMVAVSVALRFFPDQWNAIAVFYVAVVSLYANAATDFGGMNACEAAMGMGSLPEIPAEPHI